MRNHVAVYLFVSVVDPPYTIYMGKDKYESMLHKFSSIVITSLISFGGRFNKTVDILCMADEDLIKYGWPEDIWYEIIVF